MKKTTLLLVAILIISLLFNANTQIQTTVNATTIHTDTSSVQGNVNFTFFKVGKANATLIQTQNNTILIDTGEDDDDEKILAYLEENNISKIDYMIISNFDANNIGGAKDIIKKIEVGEVIQPVYKKSSDKYINYLKALAKKAIIPSCITDDLVLTIDDITLILYTAQNSAYSEEGNYSLITQVFHGNNSFLFAGDISSERISELLENSTLNSTLLKVPNYGIYDTLSEQLIKLIAPSYAIISDSEKNPADDKIIDLLNKYNAQIYETNENNIYCYSNGTEIVFNLIKEVPPL